MPEPGLRAEAFSLLELLIGIAIVAILSAILVPVLGKMHTKAAESRRVSDLRQIGVALFAYAGENDGAIPAAGNIIPYGDVDLNTGMPPWQERLDPYVGQDRRIFDFPNDPRSRSQSLGRGYFLGARAPYLEMLEAGEEGAVPPVRLVRIRNPSAYILAGECANYEFPAEDADRDNFSQDPAFGGAGQSQSNVNLLFADGHIRAVMALDSSTMTTRYDGPLGTPEW